MKVNWFWHHCRRHRKQLALLVSGSLPEQQRPELERHLASCPDCEGYRTELTQVAARLTSCRTAAESALPSPACRARWMTSLHHTARSNSSSAAQSGARREERAIPTHGWSNAGSGTIPRVAWAGLACLWLLTGFFRFSGPAQPGHVGRPALAPPQLALQLLRLETSRLPPLTDGNRQTPFGGTKPGSDRPRSQRNEVNSRG